jgi:hypothetical protein
MSTYIASAGSQPLRQVLFVAIAAAFVLISIGTWARVGSPSPSSALAVSTVDPLAMMTNAQNLATSRCDDYSLVF